MCAHQISTEKAQVKSLKATISYKEKTTKELEDRIDDMRKIQWDREKEAEGQRRDLERRNYEQHEEAERLKRSLVETEQRARDPEKLRRAHEDLERVYASLQHQYQVEAGGQGGQGLVMAVILASYDGNSLKLNVI